MVVEQACCNCHCYYFQQLFLHEQKSDSLKLQYIRIRCHGRTLRSGPKSPACRLEQLLNLVGTSTSRGSKANTQRTSNYFHAHAVALSLFRVDQVRWFTLELLHVRWWRISLALHCQQLFPACSASFLRYRVRCGLRPRHYYLFRTCAVVHHCHLPRSCVGLRTRLRSSYRLQRQTSIAAVPHYNTTVFLTLQHNCIPHSSDLHHSSALCIATRFAPKEIIPHSIATRQVC